MNTEKLRITTSRLLAQSGIDGDFSMCPLEGGTNNKIFRIDMKDIHYLLKVYFQHVNDQRDRLAAEFSFCSFAWENGLRCVPQPLGCDRNNRLGLYEFVQGRQLLSNEVTEDMVRQALDFYCEMNQYKRLPSARALPNASEARFNVAEHMQCVERRIQELKNIENCSEIDHEARQFIQTEVTESWRKVVDSVRKRASEFGLALDADIAQSDRCLSPSDFGFHNAILVPDGHLRFIDFEYAGWDDPDRMVCDFFCQPSVPVPMDYYHMFVNCVVSDLSEPERHLQRIVLLAPVYQIKWCCILLNEFLPVGMERRSFAGNNVIQNEQKLKQFEKSRQALQHLTEQKGV